MPDCFRCLAALLLIRGCATFQSKIFEVMSNPAPLSQPRVSVAQDTSTRGLPRKVLGAALGAVAAVPWSGSSIKLLGLTTLFTSAIICGSSAWALSIDTTPSWDGFNSIYYWGPANNTAATESYGQVITPDADGSLTDFTFYIAPGTSDPIFYQARVYQWDSGVWGPTGSSIYNSGTLSFSGTSGTFSPVTINTGGVSVSANTPYVLFFSTVGETQTASNYTDWGWLGRDRDVYSGGDFVFSNDPSSFTDPWSRLFTGTDLAFKANIADAAPSNVPGPLPVLGIAAAFGFSRKLRKRIKLHKSASAVSTTTGS
jgi:hypothetical protein